MNKNKGFTLIELLVVIAIIAILALVVMSTITNTKSKANNNAIKSGLNEVRTQADLFYSSSGIYTNVCSTQSDTATPKGINKMILDTGSKNGFPGPVNVNGNGSSLIRCNDSKDAWAAEIPLRNNGGYYCVDHTRKGIVTETSITSGGNYAYCR